jgi:acyl-CoA synthetase (AMP-forming)/AMP-acid ligase II
MVRELNAPPPGDLAKVDASGCFYVVDRLKELIKFKGFFRRPRTSAHRAAQRPPRR